MTDKRLHIIAFDIPYPANYGGAIDVYYRLKALSEAGVGIYLHCFYKGELHHYHELEDLCLKVHYYPRHTSVLRQLYCRPYAVVSRQSDLLLQNLLNDDYPILFEGLVSCDLLDHPQLHNRKKYFRECNIEHDYYLSLARAAHSLGSKLYYYADAIRLRRFEKVVRHASGIFAIAHQDEQHFLTHYPEVPTTYLPASHPNTTPDIPSGLGTSILYHGNLDVSENYNAARIIISHIAPLLPDVHIIIAGRYNNHVLDSLLAKVSNVELVANPDAGKMNELITGAQIHLLITEQATGLKLKLLNVLYQGRHVVVNSKMVTGTDLSPLCRIADSYTDLARECRECLNVPVSEQQKQLRKQILATYYDNKNLSNTLINNIFK